MSEQQTKKWFQSKIQWLAIALITLNITTLFRMCVNPVYLTPESSLPIMPIPIGVLIILNTIFGALIIWFRMKTSKPIK